MKKMLLLCTLMVIGFYPVICLADATQEKAQHRLPPVIYSIDIPKTVESGHSYNFGWTVMGYHETYDIYIYVYDTSNEVIAYELVSPSEITEGAYSWGSIRSKKYHYSTSLNMNFSGYQKLVVRFFASPVDDPIDNTFLSCLVPGGSGYDAADSTGRKINIYGIPAANLELDIGTGGYFAGAVENDYFITDKAYRGYHSARIKIMPIEDMSKTRISIVFYPQYGEENEAYAYKVVLPWRIKVSSFNINNATQVSEDAKIEELAVVGEEFVGNILGVFAFPIKLFFAGVPSAGDPPISSYIEEQDILKKTSFPYQKFQGIFERELENVSTQVIIDCDMTIGEVLQALKEHKMSFYIGGHNGNELFIDGLTVK